MIKRDELNLIKSKFNLKVEMCENIISVSYKSKLLVIPDGVQYVLLDLEGIYLAHI